jgi:hypothetical protein
MHFEGGILSPLKILVIGLLFEKKIPGSASGDIYSSYYPFRIIHSFSLVKGGSRGGRQFMMPSSHKGYTVFSPSRGLFKLHL